MAGQNRRMNKPPGARCRSLIAAALLASLASLALTACGGGGGSSTPPTLGAGEKALDDATVYATGSHDALPAGTTTEAAAITKHSITLKGKALDYTATAGHLVTRDPLSNAPQASFFYVAYTADGASAATRPLTFFYNGGPGSASIWLHLGSFGPKRLATGEPSTSAAKPFPLVDNAETLLDTSDLVFIDAIGTGYSEAIAPNTNQSFWGVDKDAAAFRDFIVRYLAKNARHSSPTFLFGESYGTTRSGVLAHLMETAGVPLKGVVLQSSVMNYGSNCGVTGDDSMSCAGYFPSYGEVGAYYRLTLPAQPDPDSFAAQLRSFTHTSYEPAVSNWLAHHTPPASGLLAQLQDLTGISTALWKTHLNLDPSSFQVDLIPSVLIGRYDARVSAPKGSALAAEGDPSSTFISDEFARTMGGYLRNTLRYTNASTYITLSNAINSWDFRHDGVALPDAIPDLAAAMALNPALKVLSVSGYHDLATPFYQTEKDLARLGANPNIRIEVYNGGHMTYLDDDSRAQEKNDLRSFYQQALAQ